MIRANKRIHKTNGVEANECQDERVRKTKSNQFDACVFLMQNKAQETENKSSSHWLQLRPRRCRRDERTGKQSQWKRVGRRRHSIAAEEEMEKNCQRMTEEKQKINVMQCGSNSARQQE